MLIDNQITIIKWNSKIKKYYVSLGYTFTKMGDELAVNVHHLTRASKAKIKVICDYCGEEYLCTYNNYIVQKEKELIKKDCCNKCKVLKQNESNFAKYGVKSTTQIPEIKEKQLDTLEKNYGVRNPMHSNEIKQKLEETCLEKYGVKNTLESEIIQQKITATFNEKYGVDKPFQNPGIIKKVQNTHLKKYGFINPIQNQQIKEKAKQTNINKYGVENVFLLDSIQEKARKTMYYNNNSPRSKQQIYLCNLLGGELNYPFSKYLLDIAFLEKKIYIEYNGGGHNLQVKLNKQTKEEVLKREIIRNSLLKRSGWKRIEFISSQDYLPTDEKIFEMMDIAFNIFEKGRSWIKFDIDNFTIQLNGSESFFDFGELKQLKRINKNN